VNLAEAVTLAIERQPNSENLLGAGIGPGFRKSRIQA